MSGKETGELQLSGAGDMDADSFRRYGYRIVDWLADYLAHPERYPVLSRVQPGEILQQLPDKGPENGESMDRVLEDVDRILMPGITHWNHPAFFGYFSITGSGPGILGELLAAGLNVNAMLWRTSPSATELEQLVLDWLRQWIGLPRAFEGVVYDTASISSLVAIAAAREAIPGLGVREKGMLGREGLPRLRLYASDQAHSSVEKAAILVGVGQEGVRKIECDSKFRMDTDSLAKAIQEDLSSGWRPFCVVATVGTTSTTSIDPVPKVADICKHQRLWLHVDAAYGGCAAILPEHRHVLDGCENADSIVINPHKWLFTPVDFSAFYCRNLERVREAFSLVPEYLRTSEDDRARNYMDYGPQLGRRFRALKLWMVMRFFGRAGLQERLREHIRLARKFAQWVEGDNDFELCAPMPFSTVCFRARPVRLPAESSGSPTQDRLNSLNARLLESVNATGEVFLSHTKLHGAFALRLAIGNIRTREIHVKRAWELLKEHTTRLAAEG